MLVGPFLRHDLFGQIAARATDEIDLDLRIGVLKGKNRFADPGARLSIDRHLALFLGRGNDFVPVLFPVGPSRILESSQSAATVTK